MKNKKVIHNVVRLLEHIAVEKFGPGDTSLFDALGRGKYFTIIVSDGSIGIRLGSKVGDAVREGLEKVMDDTLGKYGK